MRSGLSSTTRNSDRITDRIHFGLQLCQRRTIINILLVGPLAVTCNFHSNRQILPLLTSISNERRAQGMKVDVRVIYAAPTAVTPEPLCGRMCAWHCNPIYVGCVEHPAELVNKRYIREQPVATFIHRLLVQFDKSKPEKLVMKRHQTGLTALHALTSTWLDNEVPYSKAIGDINGPKLHCFANAQPSKKTEQRNPILPLLPALAG